MTDLPIGKYPLSRLFIRKHQVLPRLELVKDLGVLQREMAESGNSIGAQVGKIPIAKRRRDSVKLLLPALRRLRAVHNRLSYAWATGTTNQPIVCVKMLDRILSQMGLDHAGVQLSQSIAQGKEFLVVREPTGYGSLALAHVSLVTVG